MYCVRFIRKDYQPCEEYYYHSIKDADYHFSLFVDDSSDLYDKIVLEDVETNKTIKILSFAGADRSI